MRNYRRLATAGVPCPEALLLKEHVLLMRFIGTDGWAAPRLKDAVLKPSERTSAWRQVRYLVTTPSYAVPMPPRGLTRWRPCCGRLTLSLTPHPSPLAPRPSPLAHQPYPSPLPLPLTTRWRRCCGSSSTTAASCTPTSPSTTCSGMFPSYHPTLCRLLPLRSSEMLPSSHPTPHTSASASAQVQEDGLRHRCLAVRGARPP
jgi:hypothetical protein